MTTRTVSGPLREARQGQKMEPVPTKYLTSEAELELQVGSGAQLWSPRTARAEPGPLETDRVGPGVWRWVWVWYGDKVDFSGLGVWATAATRVNLRKINFVFF